jgi:hypothetical protein
MQLSPWLISAAVAETRIRTEPREQASSSDGILQMLRPDPSSPRPYSMPLTTLPTSPRATFPLARTPFPDVPEGDSPTQHGHKFIRESSAMRSVPRQMKCLLEAVHIMRSARTMLTERPTAMLAREHTASALLL